MKTYSEKTAAAVVNSLLRAVRKTSRKALHDAWTDEQGRTCALDGFRAYCLNKEPRGLSVTWTCKPDPAAAAARRENNKIIAHVFKALDAGDVEEMPAPDMDAVKSFLDADKAAGGKGLYDLGPEYPTVNAKYLYDLCRLFPVAKWFVDKDPRARMVRPVYVVADEGRALVMPVLVQGKAATAPEKPAASPENISPAPAPAAAPVEKPAAPAAPENAYYYIYSRPAGGKCFQVTDIGRGAVGMKKIHAPFYMERHVEKVKQILDHMADENPGAVFQIRKSDGKTVIYTAITYTPETFADLIAA